MGFFPFAATGPVDVSDVGRSLGPSSRWRSCARAHEKQEGVHEMGVEDMFSRICSVN